ncbi:MAG: hypothetical protein JNM76_15155 [Betaproteobacteria bacterium]|nr:hypothetical protein [Betaproteobacteria bacterium]
MAVTDAALVERTAFALGLNRDAFTISNRVDDGVTTRYNVTTQKGERFNCVVGGSINVLGRMVSEALCNRPGEPPRNPLTGR